MEVVKRVLDELLSISDDARKVVIQKESFLRLAGYVETLELLFEKLTIRHVEENRGVVEMLEEIDDQLLKVIDMLDSCLTGTKISLFLRSVGLLHDLEGVIRELGRCVLKVPFMAMDDIPKEVRDIIKATCRSMERAEFRATFLGVRTFEMINKCVSDSRNETKLAKDVFVCVARGIGLENDFDRMKIELLLFWEEKATRRYRYGNEAKRLDQIGELLRIGELAWAAKLTEGTFSIPCASDPSLLNDTCESASSSKMNAMQKASRDRGPKSPLRGAVESGSGIRLGAESPVRLGLNGGRDQGVEGLSQNQKGEEAVNMGGGIRRRSADNRHEPLYARGKALMLDDGNAREREEQQEERLQHRVPVGGEGAEEMASAHEDEPLEEDRPLHRRRHHRPGSTNSSQSESSTGNVPRRELMAPAGREAADVKVVANVPASASESESASAPAYRGRGAAAGTGKRGKERAAGVGPNLVRGEECPEPSDGGEEDDSYEALVRKGGRGSNKATGSGGSGFEVDSAPRGQSINMENGIRRGGRRGQEGKDDDVEGVMEHVGKNIAGATPKDNSSNKGVVRESQSNATLRSDGRGRMFVDQDGKNKKKGRIEGWPGGLHFELTTIGLRFHDAEEIWTELEPEHSAEGNQLKENGINIHEKGPQILKLTADARKNLAVEEDLSGLAQSGGGLALPSNSKGSLPVMGSNQDARRWGPLAEDDGLQSGQEQETRSREDQPPPAVAGAWPKSSPSELEKESTSSMPSRLELGKKDSVIPVPARSEPERKELGIPIRDGELQSGPEYVGRHRSRPRAKSIDPDIADSLSSSGRRDPSFAGSSTGTSKSMLREEWTSSSRLSTPGHSDAARKLAGIPSMFICPLHSDLMVNPVVLVSSGQTLDQSSLDKWFEEGNTTCPVTSAELDSRDVQPNDDLRLMFVSWVRQLFATLKSEECSKALTASYLWCVETEQNRELFANEGLLVYVANLLGSSNRGLRRKCMALIHCIIQDAESRKEKVIEAHALPQIVRSMSRDIREARQAVALLLELTSAKLVAEELGQTKGAIILLVAMAGNEEAEAAATDAKLVLENLGHSDKNIVRLAEAGMFGPLIRTLKEAGKDREKEVILEDICRLQLTDQSKVQLVERGIVPALAEVLKSPMMNLKMHGVHLLRDLSSIAVNATSIVDEGLLPAVVGVLLQSPPELAPLKEPLSSLLVNLISALRLRTAEATRPSVGAAVEEQEPSSSSSWIPILQRDDILAEILNVLSDEGGTPLFKTNIMNLMLGIGMGEDTNAIQARKKIRVVGFVKVALWFLESNEAALRNSAMQLLWMLSEDGGKEVADGLKTRQRMSVVIGSLDTSRTGEERAGASGILASLPVEDEVITKLMLECDCLLILSRICQTGTEQIQQRLMSAGRPVMSDALGGHRILGQLWSRTDGMDRSAAIRMVIVENALRAILRFTRPESPQLQIKAIELGLMKTLRLLLQMGSDVCRANAAKVIASLSEGAKQQSKPVVVKKRMFCFRASPATDNVCPLHGGICDPELPLCLLNANVIHPLLTMLTDRGSALLAEAALQALSTVVVSQERPGSERAARILVNEGSINPLVHVLMHGSPRARELAVRLLEVVFRIPEYCEQFSSLARQPVFNIMREGTIAAKQIAAKVLAHMNLLDSVDNQTYFK